jgi:hypothetical protein
MTITVIELTENEDGSANLQFEVDDLAYQKALIEEGLNFLLLKAAFGVTTNDIAEMLEERKNKESTD